MSYFLGVDGGGTKTHALVADESGNALGFGQGGSANWESVGLDGMSKALISAVNRALVSGLSLSHEGLSEGVSSVKNISDIDYVGMGLAGFDWPSQKEMIRGAIAPLGLTCPFEIVNDATLGILAGTSQGWGISIVSGTGNNCRGLSRNGREGRVVGGAGHWSGEFAGSWDILMRAMQAVTFEWNQRGPATALSQAFLKKTGAKNLDELVEGVYIGKFELEESFNPIVFQIAAQNDPVALDVIRWAGAELGDMVCGVIRQLSLENEPVEVVQIGSVWNGHPLMTETAQETIRAVAPHAQLVRLNVPPVVGGVILALHQLGLETAPLRQNLIKSTQSLIQLQKLINNSNLGSK
jgi:N-acetylglucosamine kinase-like BadF-type ATPase